jgi:hypothetical protein
LWQSCRPPKSGVEEAVDERGELDRVLEEEAVGLSGKIRSRAFGMWSARICELIVGIVRSLSLFVTSVG